MVTAAEVYSEEHRERQLCSELETIAFHNFVESFPGENWQLPELNDFWSLLGKSFIFIAFPAWRYRSSLLVFLEHNKRIAVR